VKAVGGAQILVLLHGIGILVLLEAESAYHFLPPLDQLQSTARKKKLLSVIDGMIIKELIPIDETVKLVDDGCSDITGRGRRRMVRIPVAARSPTAAPPVAGEYRRRAPATSNPDKTPCQEPCRWLGTDGEFGIGFFFFFSFEARGIWGICASREKRGPW